MPNVPDYSEYVKSKRVQTDITNASTQAIVKQRAPNSLRFYAPTYNLKYLPPNQLISNKFISNTIPISLPVWAFVQKFGADRAFRAIACTPDATKIVAVAANSYIYLSDNSGDTWSQKGSLDNYSSATCSSDFQIIAVATSGAPYGTIYISTNSGGTFNPISQSILYTSGLACSSNGQIIFAANQNNGICSSNDYGTTWNTNVLGISKYWTGIACNSAGDIFIACVLNGYVYVKPTSETTRIYINTQPWISVACSSDGTKLFAAAVSGYIHTSQDGGFTWVEQQGSGARNWKRVVSSANGQRLAAIVDSGKIYTSYDSGVTWYEQETTRAWYSLASSSDGKTIVAGVDAGRIHIGTASS